MKQRIFILALLINLSFIAQSQKILVDELTIFESKYVLASIKLNSDYFKSLFNYDSDSLFFDDGNNLIKYLPTELVSQALLLKPAKEILIYNNLNNFITKAHFNCFVRLETTIDTEIMAFYHLDTDIQFDKKLYYYIENTKEPDLLNIIPVENENGIEEKIKNHFNVENDRYYALNISTSVIDSVETLTVACVSIDQTQPDDEQEVIESFILDLSNKQIDTLYFQRKDWYFTYIYPVKLKYNNKPVYMVGWGYPSSDYLGSIILNWNGEDYEIAELQLK